MMAKLTHEQLQSLKAQAMIPEKGGERFSVRLGVVGGHMDAAQLQAVAQIAQRMGDGCVHLTTRQGVEIPHVPFENLDRVQAELKENGLRLAAAGRCVRSIIACPGPSCVHSVVDCQGLAQRLHARIGACKNLPHKFKIAIAGCLNGCTKPNENDLGVMGRAKGFTLFVGGKMGKHPRWADILPIEVPDEQVLFGIVEAVIDWFASNGTPGERFGSTIDRVGLAELVQHVVHTLASAQKQPEKEFAK